MILAHPDKGTKSNLNTFRHNKQKHLKVLKKTEEERNLEDSSAQTVNGNICEVVLDKGYQGVQNDGVRAILSKKKPRLGRLTALEK